MADDATLLTALQHADSFFPGGGTAFSWGLESLCNDRQVASAADVERFLAGPGDYLDPARYLRMVGDALPRPPVLFKVPDAEWFGADDARGHFETYLRADGAALAAPLQAWSPDEVDIRFDLKLAPAG